MGFLDWVFRNGEDEYSSQTEFQSPSSGFEGSYSSSVTKCEPDETGETRCRRYVTRRSQTSPGSRWTEERTDEEVPYEEVGMAMPGLSNMMEDMNRMMEEFGHFFGGFRMQGRPRESAFSHEEPQWKPRPATPRYQDSGQDDVFDA